MKLILQRVAHASVTVDGQTIAKIGPGLLILIGIGPQDTPESSAVLAKKTAELRIFEDGNGKMNRSLLDENGAALVVSNFTLYADASHGRRPSYTNAAPPSLAEPLYLTYAQQLRDNGVQDVQTGSFGADMKVDLLNDGPVTIILEG